MNIRASGVLLHVTSLPSPHGVGDLGPASRRFADILAQNGQAYWQVLPLSPTLPELGNSPYSSFSAFGGNPLLVSPEKLAEERYLSREELGETPGGDPRSVDFEAAHAHKERLLGLAFARRRAGLARNREFQLFCVREADWLHDHALYVALKARFGGAPWTEWPEPFRDRHPEALAEAVKSEAEAYEYERFVQYLFFRQWRALKKYCARRSVRLIGDVPIYVTHDSVDCWANRRLFKLDAAGERLAVAGVPPDYFSATGQLWGNPVFDWDALAAEGFEWWIRRIARNLELFDLVRLDHFRGFSAYWEVPAGAETAMEGRWVDAPGHALFAALARRLPSLPIIAEDLGLITPDVRELRDRFDFPGMKILQFGFNHDPANPDAPHNATADCVVYSGTHDNATARGWFAALDDHAKDLMREYVGGPVREDDAHWYFLRLGMMSVARTCIFPVQDVLGLDGEARMNTPGLARGNWAWRLADEEMDPARYAHLGRITTVYGRR